MAGDRAIVRKAVLGDIAAIQAVASITWAATYAGLIPEDVQRHTLATWYSTEAIAQSLARHDSLFLVAIAREKVIGFAQYIQTAQDAAELIRIYVLPEEQHHGVGALLLELGVSQLSSAGVKKLFVSAERENTSGRRFYQHQDFTEGETYSLDIFGYTLALVRCQRSI